MKKLLALAVCLSVCGYAVADIILSTGELGATVIAKPYCLSSSPNARAGYYVAATGNSTVDSSVAGTIITTEHDSNGNAYVTTMTVAASGVGSITTIPACAVR
jgi:hypothetical protein